MFTKITSTHYLMVTKGTTAQKTKICNQALQPAHRRASKEARRWAEIIIVGHAMKPRSGERALHKLNLLLQHTTPGDGNQHRKKETSPLAHFARNSLPHKKLPLFVPQCSFGTTIYQKYLNKIWKPTYVVVPSELQAIVAKATLPTKLELLSSLTHHPSPAQIASRFTTLRFVLSLHLALPMMLVRTNI